jgi:ApaG protein
MPKQELTITVRAAYVPEQSDPAAGTYFFAYTVTIMNTGKVPTQVVSRHWLITDGNNRTHEVKGLGVVGKQPLLNPDEMFEYTSGCPLPTPYGSMRGSYLCVTEEGERFDAQIPEFALALPRAVH